MTPQDRLALREIDFNHTPKMKDAAENLLHKQFAPFSLQHL